MFLSLNWLKDFVSIDKNPTEVAAMLSETGTHAESVKEFKGVVKGVKIALITDIRKHKNADRLSVCDVDFGDRKDVIVTAATNMKAGDKVGVATPGAILADGTEIEPHDFRGVVSNGMFVSYEEIGFEKDVISKEDQLGILILPEDAPPGADLIDYLHLNGVVEFEITPNRPDCLSVYGLALESAATFSSQIKNVFGEFEVAPEKDFKASVDTEDVNAYSLGIVKNVKVMDSPVWLKVRLMESGIRPVNNIVDVTNYVMLELGLPMHAFDKDKLATDEIVVKNAKDCEELVLLDEMQVKTKSGDILITNGKIPIALAGVMGLKNTEITAETENIVLEGAHFNRYQIKSTAKRLDIGSDAAARFQKKLDETVPKLAVKRAIELLAGMGFKDATYLEVKTSKKEKRTIETRYARVKKLLGVDIDRDLIIEKLNLLGVKSVFKGDLILSEIPTFRDDLNVEVDIIEEIGRLYCYKNIPATPISTDLTVGSVTPMKNLTNKIRCHLKANGYSETLTYSFVGPKLLSKIGYVDESKLLKLINPLGEEFSVMRPTMNAHFLQVAEKNFNMSNGGIQMFEVGHVFKNHDGNYEQTTRLNLLRLGVGDFYDLKATVERLFKSLNINDFKLVRSKQEFYHPGVSADLYVGDTKIGDFGRVHPLISKNFGLKEVYMGEFYLEEILNLADIKHVYRAKSKFQTVKKELSFVVDKQVMYGQLRDELLKIDSEILKDVYFYDVYSDESLGDKKSLTVGLEMYADDRTLKDEEIKNIMRLAIEIVKDKFSANLR